MKLINKSMQLFFTNNFIVIFNLFFIINKQELTFVFNNLFIWLLLFNIMVEAKM